VYGLTGDDPHGCPKPLRCSVNPVAGRSPLFDTIPKSESPKNVGVIGGGAAGMEAGRRLAERGHKVILFEKEPILGGTLIPAGANKLKSDIRRYFEWSVRMVERTPGLDIRKHTAATRALVMKEKPDAVIVAVGSEPFYPENSGD
jgi:NADPH-dependent 2,4-dienoyl-CoA reductase/sulfur reductase-like enzyme